MSIETRLRELVQGQGGGGGSSNSGGLQGQADYMLSLKSNWHFHSQRSYLLNNVTSQQIISLSLSPRLLEVGVGRGTVNPALRVFRHLPANGQTVDDSTISTRTGVG